MPISIDHGLAVWLTDAEEALNTDWLRFRGQADVVRVDNPPAGLRAELAQRGFFVKPAWLTWVARCLGSEDEFLAGMPPKERQSIAAARRRAAANDVQIHVGLLTEQFMSEFLALYEARISEMRHGWSVARESCEDLLAHRESYFTMRALRNGELVGASINQASPGGPMRIRFSAVDVAGRHASLARLLYLDAITEARSRGFGWASLGNDPNLYGHLVEPGLLRFKARLMFLPRPAHLVSDRPAYDCADLVIGFDALSDPAVLLSYAVPENSDDRLQIEVFSAAAAVDVGPYRSRLPFSVRAHVVR